MKLKNKKKNKQTMIIFLCIIVVLSISVALFVNQKSFGKIAVGKRLERIQKSPNYSDKQFQNITPTLQLTEGASYMDMASDFLFKKHERVTPKDKIPSIKTDLINLDKNQDILVWFGHSSYFIQIDGKRILVDPVFSGSASPASFVIKAFDGSDVYKAEDIPSIDYLIITHDHWDHLDYETVMKLKEKTNKVICSLGVGEHLEYWGFDIDKIVELDWYENTNLENEFNIHCLPTRHFSGRGFTPRQSLWASYMLTTPSTRIYLGGDGGYGSHFTDIGKQFPNIDLAILENGQYGENWKYIHMLPEEVVQATKDLGAKRLLPVHSGKFSLAYHPWDAPLKRVSKASENKNLPILTPMIGEIVNLKDNTQIFSKWWEAIE